MLSAALGSVLCVLASCGGTENRGQSAATGGAGTGGTAAFTGGSVGNTGGVQAADSGGASSGGAPSTGGTGGHTGGAAVDSGGTDGTDAGSSSSGGRVVDDAGSDGPFDLCARHGAPCCVPAIADVKPGTGCTIEVFDKYVNATYEYDALEAKVASLGAGIALTVTDADIASATAEPAPARRIELRLTADASTRLGLELEQRTTFPFRFSCGGEKLFLGVIYWWGGAAALRTPVLHVERTADGDIVLLLGAWQSAWMGLGLDGPGNPVLQERLDRPELRAPLCEKGILKELDPRQRGWTDMPPRQ